MIPALNSTRITWDQFFVNVLLIIHTQYQASGRMKILSVLLLASLAFVSVEAANKPHIIAFLIDDYGWANVGYHRAPGGDPETQTPNLDALKAAGVELDRFYAYRFCSPTRSSLQTGRLPIHVNTLNLSPDFHNPKDPVSGFSAVPRNMTGIATKLKSAGYATHQIGKWDAGMATYDHTPLGRGYDTSFGYFHHANDYWTQRAPDGCPLTTDLWRNTRPAHGENNTGEYEESMFLREALRIIEAHDPSQPLFLFYALHLCHAPLEVPDEYLQKFNFIKDDPARKHYMAMTHYMDGVVGNVTAALKRKGLWDNALVTLNSDNGGPVSSANNYPLKGGKTSNWEGGVRVNAFATGGLIPQAVRGTKQEGYGHVCDWYATFCYLAGVDPTDHRAALADLPPIDSLNLWPLISGQTTVSPRTEIPLDVDPDTYPALIVGDFKVLVGPQHLAGWTGPHSPNGSSPAGIPTIEHCGRGCLYNIKEDPNEYNNLAASNPHKLNQLLNRLAEVTKTYFNPDRGTQDPAACRNAQQKNGGFWGPWLQ